MSTDVQHLESQNRYVLNRDGEQVGLTDYRITGDAIYLTHTEVDPRLRGRGLGAEMVQGVLDQIKADTGYRVVAACPFVRSWLDRHPEYSELEQRGL
ncbi:GNAT family N-acetyltransferase [Marisediminicola senii]|uniref:GNAT family N-acetyltransferase n=1 Tax=Marisediminicola senii TaxID=2711233 RepID=UPI0013EE080C|nr:GNAT family N-acetyltransferase [Marisediminicola senii]